MKWLDNNNRQRVQLEKEMFMRPMCTDGKKHKKTLAYNSL